MRGLNHSNGSSSIFGRWFRISREKTSSCGANSTAKLIAKGSLQGLVLAALVIAMLELSPVTPAPADRGYPNERL